MLLAFAFRLGGSVEGTTYLGELPTGDVQTIQFVDERSGWCTTWYQERAHVWATRDGGRSWNELALPKVRPGNIPSVGPYLSAIHLETTSKGWLALNEQLFRTDDFGASWIKLGENPFTVARAEFQGLVVMNEGKVMWIYGRLPRYDPKAYRDADPRLERSLAPGIVYEAAVFRSLDGGRHWTRQGAPDSRMSLWILRFSDQLHGYAIGDNRATAYITQNGSQTWFPVASSYEWTDAHVCGSGLPVDGASDDDDLVDITFLDVNEGWLAREYGDIFHTVDGGRTWCQILRRGQAWPIKLTSWVSVSLTFLSSLEGWKIGNDDRLYVTRDGGKAWHVAASSQPVSHLVALRNAEAVLFTSGGKLFSVRRAATQ